MLEELKQLLLKTFELEESQIKLEASFKDDLDLDSIDLAELFMEIEHKFSIRIPEEDAMSIKTINDAVEILKKHGIS
jgi:acyl carrier protein